jgi:hypothetical protein
VITQYVTGLTICSITRFTDVFKAKLTAFTYLDATGDGTLSSLTCLEVLKEVKEISTAAKAIYDHLNAGNLWNIPGKPGLHTNFVTKCDNCGSPDHVMKNDARRLMKHGNQVVEVEAAVAVQVVAVELDVEEIEPHGVMMTRRRKLPIMVAL